MGKDISRRSKVTPETKEESRRLAQIWAEKKPMSQAEFGEAYSIGNQSAVGQFLRGDVPLSLKAASGFAKGLGCRIEDFSPRLAAEAAGLVTSASPTSELGELTRAVEELPQRQRDWVLMTLREAVKLARETVTEDAVTQTTIAIPHASSKRRRAA